MMHRLCTRFAAAFPLWIVLGCAWAWWRPADWTWFRNWIEPGLGLIMLGMGLTLRVADFVEVGKRPGAVAVAKCQVRRSAKYQRRRHQKARLLWGGRAWGMELLEGLRQVPLR